MQEAEEQSEGKKKKKKKKEKERKKDRTVRGAQEERRRVGALREGSRAPVCFVGG